MKEKTADIILSAEKVSFKGILYYDNIKIERGSITFIMGESGSGKSTLLKLFCCLLSADEGKICYDGADILSLDAVALRREVLLCSQAVYLFGGEIRDCFDEYYRYRQKELLTDEQKAEYMKLCCLELPLDNKTELMSGGERQRLFAAVCLSLCPKVLMLDEPTSALDSATADSLMQSLCAYAKKQGITLIVVSHDRDICRKYAEREICIEKAQGE